MGNTAASASAASSFRVLFVDEGLVIGEIGPLCVLIWRDRVSAPRVQQVAAGLTQLARQKESLGLLIVIEATSDPPPDEVRSELAAIVASQGSKLSCLATTIEATGFRAAFIRSVLSGIALLDRRSDIPARAVFADLGAAAQWLGARLTLPDDFLTRVEELRAHFERLGR